MDSSAVPDSKGIILGTAGHIDHGKSSLVTALTGIDPDRLKEEKERGITIDLGFAGIVYPDGLTVGIVDVPGHERLIKNMLAGAGGIDVVLMVIAADEGIMPQSREHLAICELLKIKAGIIALTKADLVEQDWLCLVTDDIRGFVKGTFLNDAEILPVSAKTGLNIETLKERIRNLALKVQPKLIRGLFRMPIDRVFTLKGFGTVVTGTALSGSIAVDSPVEILPSKIPARVRGLQTHGRSTEKAYAGQRIGINLQGVDRESLKRGDVVADTDRLLPTREVDAGLEMLKTAPAVKNRDRVHFYSGTSETIARVIVYNAEEVGPGASCYCQFRLEDPVVVLSGDRYVIRRFSPLETIGGGEILDPFPVRRRKKAGINDLVIFERGTLKDKIGMKVLRSRLRGVSTGEITGWVQGDIVEIESAIKQLLKEGTLIGSHDLLFHKESFGIFRETLIASVGRFHQENPLKRGMSREELRARARTVWKTGWKDDEKVFDGLVALIKELAVDKDIVRSAGFSVALSTANEGIKQRILSTLDKQGFQAPLKNELSQQLSIKDKELNDILTLLAKEGELVRINDSFYITRERYDAMIGLLRRFYEKKAEMSIAEFRDLLGTTRKYALPLIEYLDSKRVTLRVGDQRRLMLK